MFRNAVLKYDARTQNGDPSHSTTKSPLLDFFGGICRVGNTIPDNLKDKILLLLARCWAEDPLLTLKAIFYKRDCRNGAGERKIFEICMRWLFEHYPTVFDKNLKHVPQFGYWKDLLQLADLDCDAVAKLFGSELKTGLAAKWAPTVGGHFDRAHPGLCRKIAHHAGLYMRYWQQLYRQLLSSRRDALRVVERQMTLGEWSHIDYARVPSIAMDRSKDAFRKHTPERFGKWLTDVKSGKSKVNAQVLMPHQLITQASDPVAEAQWNAIVEKTRSLGKLNRTVAMSDVSESMDLHGGVPMQVSVALGCLISQCAVGSWRDMLITFSESPHFLDLSDCKTLNDRVGKIKRDGVGYNTDLVRAFEVMLQRAQDNKVPADEMPEKIILISDMQFDVADRNTSSLDTIRTAFRDAGYQLPNIVFWNVTGNASSFPAERDERGICMISGFSQNLLMSVMDGEIPDPMSIMMRALNHPRYNCLTL